MNKPYTVKELKQLCEEQIKKGNGDEVIMISSDDEGNNFHYLWYAFSEADIYYEDYINENIAKKEDTIILG